MKAQNVTTGRMTEPVEAAALIAFPLSDVAGNITRHQLRGVLAVPGVDPHLVGQNVEELACHATEELRELRVGIMPSPKGE